jgi:deoxycytidylate deaminase
MYKPRRKYKITATIFDKHGRILAQESNSYTKTHPYQAKLAARAGKPNKVYLHAEIKAIIKAQKFGEPYKILIERYNSEGEPVLAKPCEICQLAIKEAGIKRIEYTI